MNRTVRVVLAYCLTILLFTASRSAYADIKGAISGIVMDPSGMAVADVGAKVTNVATGVEASTKTDEKGVFSFPALSVGVYKLEIKVQGYGVFTETNIVINANSSVRADVHLSLATVTSEVEVKSNPLLIETQNTQMGEVIEAEKITAVPLSGRSFINLLALQPGVSPYSITAFNTGTGIGGKTISRGSATGSQSANGGSSGATAYLVN